MVRHRRRRRFSAVPLVSIHSALLVAIVVITMSRPPFSIRTLLWLTLVVAAFFGGALFERQRATREPESPFYAPHEANQSTSPAFDPYRH